LKDLKERFAKIEISASKPIVPFRETIVKAPGISLKSLKLMVDMVALKDTSVRRGTATITSPSGDVTIRIRTRPLPDTVKEFLIKHAESMKQFLLDRKTRVEEEGDVATERVSLEKRLSFQDFRKELQEILNAEGGDWSRILDRYNRPSL